MNLLCKISLTLAFLVLTAAGSAAELYVTDSFEVTLRSGPGTDYKIIAMLKSGARLEFVEQNDDGWFRVKTSKGLDGWIVRRYVTEDKPKGPLLAAARATIKDKDIEIDKLAKRSAKAEKEVRELSAKKIAVDKKLTKVERDFTRWKGDNVDLIELRETLKDAETLKASADAELEILRAENRKLDTRQKFYWFFSGTTVLLVGWALGYFYTSSRASAKAKGRYRI